MLQVLHQTPAGIMEPRPEAGLPATLGRWVGEIVLSIPQPARRTVAELIVGGLLAGGGHVTQAFLALTPGLAGVPLASAVGSGCWAWLLRCAASSGARAMGDGASPSSTTRSRPVHRPRRRERPCASTMPTSGTVPPSCCARPLS